MATNNALNNTIGTAGVVVSNKNYVTVNTSTGALGSDAGPSAGSLILIQTQTTAGASSIDFTSGITTTYSSYFILMRNILAASATPNLQMLFSVNAGSSYLSANYFTGYNATSYNSATWGNANSNSLCIIGSLNTTATYNGFMYIHNLANASQDASYSGQSWQGNGTQQNIIFGTNSTTTINALRFNTSSGNIIGSISLYGVSN